MVIETPFSLELLATVDWIRQEHPDWTAEQIHEAISKWTKRKAELIKPFHVKVAFKQLTKYQQYLNI